jgi:hypothetical protein
MHICTYALIVNPQFVILNHIYLFTDYYSHRES